MAPEEWACSPYFPLGFGVLGRARRVDIKPLRTRIALYLSTRIRFSRTGTNRYTGGETAVFLVFSLCNRCLPSSICYEPHVLWR